eukprot:2679939-Rhodomonas_salina.2
MKCTPSPIRHTCQQKATGVRHSIVPSLAVEQDGGNDGGLAVSVPEQQSGSDKPLPMHGHAAVAEKAASAPRKTRESEFVESAVPRWSSSLAAKTTH